MPFFQHKSPKRTPKASKENETLPVQESKTQSATTVGNRSLPQSRQGSRKNSTNVNNETNSAYKPTVHPKPSVTNSQRISKQDSPRSYKHENKSDKSLEHVDRTKRKRTFSGSNERRSELKSFTKTDLNPSRSFEKVVTYSSRRTSVVVNQERDSMKTAPKIRHPEIEVIRVPSERTGSLRRTCSEAHISTQEKWIKPRMSIFKTDSAVLEKEKDQTTILEKVKEKLEEKLSPRPPPPHPPPPPLAPPPVHCCCKNFDRRRESCDITNKIVIPCNSIKRDDSIQSELKHELTFSSSMLKCNSFRQESSSDSSVSIPIKQSAKTKQDKEDDQDHDDGADDDDKLFLLSILPAMKKLDPDKKMDAKLEIMLSLQNALNGDTARIWYPKLPSSSPFYKNNLILNGQFCNLNQLRQHYKDLINKKPLQTDDND